MRCVRSVAYTPLQYEAAVEDYGKVLAEHPEDQTACFNVAVCRLEQKRYEAADSLVDRFIGQWPTYVRAYLMKAQIKLLQRDTVAGCIGWILP